MSEFSEVAYAMALSDIKSLGPVQQRSLARQFRSFCAVFQSSFAELEQTSLLKPSQIHDILNCDQLPAYQQLYDRALHKNINVVSIFDEDYPQNLHQIALAPTHLFYQGNLGLLNHPQLLSVVGARKMTVYGERMTRRLVRELCEQGTAIVSGLAFGVDVTAHEACLQCGGKTIAVQAQGVDQGYPAAHRREFQEILDAEGCVVSEFAFPKYGGGEKFLFPRRNRIISGLSQGVLVVEAARRSGSLITARYALEQNRNVYAVPGDIDRDMSEGCNRLIQEGAKAVVSVSDILEDFDMNQESPAEVLTMSQTDLFESPLESQIYSLCARDPQSLDHIIESVDASASSVSAVITKMELIGKLKAVAGRKFLAVA